ncbi:P-loop containing nucleoside triphosphate hydrolases superfamily protein [Raphanus sativus]|uniref:ATP-dependent RNA helicase n=1 Tax=Raphanus sativus TaxID=3726 RepID=A0A6J0LTL4_RAPSA|nr:DEAD-box ATP-dependent RNA helicase 31 isoform X2 [Raphanus sativus]KAJ4897344.1 P-loop containing nucleoside triphosphate hydrolases superfamily protein [Raphanus sativus]
MPLKFPRRIRIFTHSIPRTTNLASFNSVARAYHRHNTSSSSAPPFLSRIFSFTSNHFSTHRPNGGETRASSRSLIEDEEELSNWVTDLRPGSLRVHLTSDDDDVDRSGGRRNQDSRGAIRNKVGSFRENRFSERGKGSNFGRSESSFRGRKERSLGRDREEGYKGLRKQRRGDVVDEESSDEDVMGGIGDLLSEEDEEEEEDEDYEFLKKKAASAFGFDRDKGVEARSDVKSSDSYLTKTRFDQYTLSPLSLKALNDAGYETMTVVQEATLPIILKGKDVLAKAKTGTGKTVAFLLPSIEVVVKSPPTSPDNKRPPILALVICPTRELANQAATEANTLLKYHPTIGVQVVIGGTRLGLEQKRMQTNPCQILVATPGRLKDHIENTPGLATRLKGVKVLVLDEADHLLDMGFRKDIERILSAVPKERQTFLFSATVPEEVRQMCLVALRRDHEFINCVHEGTGETHQQVRQTHMIASLDKHFSLLYTLLRAHIADNVDYKVIVFCTTAMVTKLVADLLGELNLNVREIHSRKPQSYRTRVSNEFRKSKGLILVTSDVSARGVDYPDVTLVLQVGLPKDREQYIHRLGRTGRKGKEGEGILLLAPWEEYFLSSLKDLPITKSSLPSTDPETVKKVQKALCHVEMRNKEAAYQAWLGYYNSQKMIGRDKERLVELANEFSRSMGLDNPPAIPKLILGKMGLKNVPGLRAK